MLAILAEFLKRFVEDQSVNGSFSLVEAGIYQFSKLDHQYKSLLEFSPFSLMFVHQNPELKQNE